MVPENDARRPAEEDIKDPDLKTGHVRKAFAQPRNKTAARHANALDALRHAELFLVPPGISRSVVLDSKANETKRRAHRRSGAEEEWMLENLGYQLPL